MITNIAAIVYIIMSVVMFIMCVVVIIKNYSNSMFSRNSYLTHTLPAHKHTAAVDKNSECGVLDHCFRVCPVSVDADYRSACQRL